MYLAHGRGQRQHAKTLSHIIGQRLLQIVSESVHGVPGQAPHQPLGQAFRARVYRHQPSGVQRFCLQRFPLRVLHLLPAAERRHPSAQGHLHAVPQLARHIRLAPPHHPQHPRLVADDRLASLAAAHQAGARRPHLAQHRLLLPHHQPRYGAHLREVAIAEGEQPEQVAHRLHAQLPELAGVGAADPLQGVQRRVQPGHDGRLRADTLTSPSWLSAHRGDFRVSGFDRWGGGIGDGLRKGRLQLFHNTFALHRVQRPVAAGRQRAQHLLEAMTGGDGLLREEALQVCVQAAYYRRVRELPRALKRQDLAQSLQRLSQAATLLPPARRGPARRARRGRR